MSWENLNKPFKVGDVVIPGRLVLGPMAGVTDSVFRRLCADCGCDMLYSEMVSAKGLFYNNSNTGELLRVTESEYPIGLQLFGSDPELLGDMAEKVKDRPFDFIDINMGCPVPKVVGNGEGSFLMTDCDRIAAIVENVVKKAGKPVTVKIRKGFTTDNCVEAAVAAYNSGAAAIAVHGRLRSEYYSGHADWDAIARVKKAVSIPVIGSGDVTDEESCLAMLEQTGVDGIMIARAARGNPWIFKRCSEYLETGNRVERPSVSEVREMVLKQAAMSVEDKGEFIAMQEMRKHTAWYFQGYPESAKLRGSVNLIKTYEDLKNLLDLYESKLYN